MKENVIIFGPSLTDSCWSNQTYCYDIVNNMNIVCDFTLYNLWRTVAVQLPRNSSHSHECLRLVRAVQQAGGPIISINDNQLQTPPGFGAATETEA